MRLLVLLSGWDKLARYQSSHKASEPLLGISSARLFVCFKAEDMCVYTSRASADKHHERCEPGRCSDLCPCIS